MRAARRSPARGFPEPSPGRGPGRHSDSFRNHRPARSLVLAAKDRERRRRYPFDLHALAGAILRASAPRAIVPDHRARDVIHVAVVEVRVERQEDHAVDEGHRVRRRGGELGEGGLAARAAEVGARGVDAATPEGRRSARRARRSRSDSARRSACPADRGARARARFRSSRRPRGKGARACRATRSTGCSISIRGRCGTRSTPRWRGDRARRPPEPAPSRSRLLVLALAEEVLDAVAEGLDLLGCLDELEVLREG
jgi:hypothetical protein